MLTPGWHHDTYVESYQRSFFQNYAQGKVPRECGVKDVDIGGLADVPALVAALVRVRTGISCEQVEKIVREHIALTHNDPGVIDAGATLVRILFAINEGQSVQAAIRSQAGHWLKAQDADQWLGEEDNSVVGARFHPSCPIQNSMPASLFLAYKHHNDFTEGVSANAMAGGDNCHRGAVVGSILGAALGVPDRLKIRADVAVPKSVNYLILNGKMRAAAQ